MKNILLAVLAASFTVAPATAQVPSTGFFDTQTDAMLTIKELLQSMPNESLKYVGKEIPLGVEFVGLKSGRCDSKGNGPIHRIRVLLRRWNAHLDLGTNPRCFSEQMAASLTLFKAVYGIGIDGHSIDPKTADLLGGMELDAKHIEPKALRQFPSGEILYWASRHLGKPYQMGADGSSAMDCGLLTKLAFIAAGLVAPNFSRLADTQYIESRNVRILNGARSKGNLKLAYRKNPVPGSLIFFRNNTSQSGIAYDGVTHVGLFIAGGGLGPNSGFILQAASRGVTIDRIRYDDSGWIAGFGEVLVAEAKPEQ